MDILFEALKEVFLKINEFCVISLPILSFFTLVIPKTRKWIGTKIKQFFGIETLKQEIASLKDENKKFNEKLEKHIDKDEDKMLAQMSNLKHSLMREFAFYIDRGYITLEELDVLQEVYISYRKSGGNGVFQKKWENQILNLPDKPETNDK